MKNWITLSLILLVGFSLNAQPGSWHTKSNKAIKYVERAMEATRSINPNTGYPDYEGGIYWLDKAIEKDPNFYDAYLLKGEYCIQSGRALEGIEAYQTVLTIEGFRSSTGYIYYDLAVLEWSQGMYTEALEHAKKYSTFKAANPEMLKEAEWIVVNCEFAIKAMQNPVPFNPVNVGSGVNSMDPEYFPTLTVDQKQLLFTRRTTSSNGHVQEDFYVSDDLDGYWSAGQPMPGNINTPFNEGAPTFAPDGRTLIFVACAVERVGYGSGRRGYGSCDLFITEKVGNSWLDPINLPGAVNTQHWETQPSLSSDGKTLYFIRGQIKGSGGRNKRNGDIYVSHLQENGMWGKAEKLPNNINTPYSESSVLIHPDGRTLYFASNGHIGMGGSDLYMTTLQEDGTWSDPKNLGYPINTNNDENSLLVYADGSIAIFGSDRSGGMGELDLYTFEMPESIRPTKTIYMTGTVFDVTNNNKLEAEFKLIDLETGKEVINSWSDRVNGSFLVTLPINKNYMLEVKKEGYHPYSVNFNLTVPENSNEPYHRDVPLIPSISKDPVRLDNVFFDLDSYNLRKESYIELDKLVDYLNANPGMKIELQGHTDFQGDDDHNMELSKNRAKSVMNYLISKGIDKTRLTSQGFGETQPDVILNEKGEKVTLTEEYINSLPTDKEKKAAHQQNRRTVYVVKSL